MAPVWDWEGGAVRAELRGQSSLFDVDFSPDGRLLLTAEADGAAELWASDVEQRIAEFREPQPPDLSFDAGAQAARFSPDGRWFVVAGGDSRAHVYLCDVCAPLEGLLRAARRRAARPLTAEEQRRYLSLGN